MNRPAFGQVVLELTLKAFANAGRDSYPAVAEHLHGLGYHVSGLVRKSARTSPALDRLKSKIEIYDGNLQDSSGLKAKVQSVTYLGEVWECDVELNALSLKMKQLDPAGRAPSVGDVISVGVPPHAVLAFPAEPIAPQET